jgi:hypothetical protein
MWNASALGSEHLVIEGTDWRSRLRAWAVIQRDMLDRHPWITQMPMAAPPVAPNSLHFVERGLETMDDTFLADSDKLRVIGLLSSYTLSEARMAADAMRAAKAAAAAVAAAGPEATGPGPDEAGGGGAPEPPENFEALLRELVDARTYPHLYRLAWDEEPDPYGPQTEREQFLFGVDTILDGIQALIDRTGRAG